MQALPCVRVRDLPPAASFYSAVTQPLGLRFISANAGSIVYGNPSPTFEVKATPAGAAPQPTRIVLAASSPSAVSAFHAAARRANPRGNSHIHLKEDDGASGESRASATDLEGNVIEIVFAPSRQSQSTTRSVTGILGWNLDAATSIVGAARSAAGSAGPSRPGLATLLSAGVPAEDESYRIIRRSFTSSTTETAQPEQQSSKGLGAGTLLGVLGAVAAGAAVGAGISYALAKKGRDRAPREEFEAAPPFQRRATYPDPYTGQQPRYVEMERTVEKVRYPEQYPPGSNKYPQPNYTTRRSQADTTPRVQEVDDRASRHNPTPRTRDRSVGPSEKPLMIAETEHKSTVGSERPEPPRLITEDEPRSQVESRQINPKAQLHAELFKRTSPKEPSKAPSKAPSQAPSQAPDARSRISSRSRRHDDDDRRSHASSRHRTVRPPREAEVETYVSARSEKSATTVRPAKTQSKAPSRVPSYVSAREIPSPPKEAEWTDIADDNDGGASVAPSDSISCVDPEERPKPHARDIPFLQNRERIMIQ
ncbi:hypothetical protein F5B18DRAFT_221945 [Nemania serpens]|nr:hypothetical protein F5B18DRAFT_221945 [Nemania serpens]